MDENVEGRSGGSPFCVVDERTIKPTWDALTWASVGVGAAAVAGGLIWYLAAPRGTSRSARAPSLTGSFASTGGTMRLGWSF